MKIVQNRKEWRHDTVMRLVEARQLVVADALEEVKQLEKYVFHNDFIVEIESKRVKKALKKFIESLNGLENRHDVAVHAVSSSRSFRD